ncbi:MAG: hypothetical protein JWN61_1071 [Pseudonocardiales bacterium]|nr:hypothetical protein [Pseudonocardiales bacterium]
MTDRYVVKIVTDGVPDARIVELGGLDQAAAEAFTARLRADTEEARDVGVPEITAQVPGGETLTFDPRAIATIDLEVADS